jgi:AraC-like DNA-binding protein
MDILDPVLHFLPWLVFGQGLFLSAAVISRWKHKGNRYLGTFLFLLSLHGLVALAWQNPGGRIVPEITVFLSGLPFLYGPLIFRYVWHGLYRNWKDPVPFAVHAIPATVNFLLYGAIYLLVGRDDFAEIAGEVFAGDVPAYVAAVEYLKFAQGLIYAFLILRLVRRHQEALSRWAARDQRGRWLGWLAASFAFTWALVLVSAVLLWTGSFHYGLGKVVSVAQLVTFLAFLYMVSFFALRYPAVLDPQEVREAIRRKLNLPAGFIQETMLRLKAAEERSFFIDSEVTLPSLAEKLGLHPNALSFIVNEETGTGFREYLNGLRLEHFLKLASAHTGGKTDGATFLEMAFASGFSSKTTFLRAFRTRFETTPADFLAVRGGNSHTPGTGTHTGAS